MRHTDGIATAGGGEGGQNTACLIVASMLAKLLPSARLGAATSLGDVADVAAGASPHMLPICKMWLGEEEEGKVGIRGGWRE